MNTEKMRILCKGLDECETELKKLYAEAGKLRAGVYQNTVSMKVNGRELVLITLNPTCYKGMEVRGREMILLGVQKVYAEWIGIRERDVQRLKDEIREVARGEANG